MPRPLSYSQSILAIGTAIVLAGPFDSLHALSLNERPAYVEAVKALKEGQAAQAAEKLEQLIEAADDLSPTDATEVRLILVEALVRAGDPGHALTVAIDPGLMAHPRGAFWRGLALIEADRPTEALEVLSAIEPNAASDGFSYRDELALNLAMCRYRVGESEAALETLQGLITRTEQPVYRERALLLAAQIEIDRNRLDEARELIERPVSRTGDPAAVQERNLLRGRIALQQGNLESASDIFNRAAREAAGLDAGDRATLTLATLAESEQAPGRAAELLVDLIDTNPQSVYLPAAFQRLVGLEDFLLSQQGDHFRIWIADATQPNRQALALFFQGIASRQEGDTDTALSALGQLRSDFPLHPLREATQVQQAETLIFADRFDEAGLLIEDLKQRAELPDILDLLPHLEARLAVAKGENEIAMDRFQQAIDAAPDLATLAATAFNGALASVMAEDNETFEAMVMVLNRTPLDQLAGDLLIERGLHEASLANAQAFASLERFVLEFPEHRRIADAELVLAELYLSQVPPQPVAAQEHLDAALELSLTEEQRERLDYIAMWTAMAGQDSREATNRAQHFLDHWPDSSRRSSVFMVMGESYFRNGNYEEAADTFEALVRETPDSPHTDAALLFAGKAASLSLDSNSPDRAISFWDRLAEKGGSLSDNARHEEGLLQLASENFDEAVVAFDRLIAMEEADPQLKIAALADKGEAYYAKAAVLKVDAASSLEAGALAFSEVAEHPEASKSWRLLGAVRKGKCLEALGKNEEALSIYEEVVENGAPAGPVAAVPTSEFDWFFRAGLSAIRLLQADQRWEEAVAIADRVSQFGGPRAAEASQIGDRLRLKHFIWQEPGQ